MKTSPGICQKKRRFATREEADAVALQADVTLRTYKCALCHSYHLTRRTKGLRVPRAADRGAIPTGETIDGIIDANRRTQTQPRKPL